MKKITAFIMTFLLAFTAFGLFGCDCGNSDSNGAFTVVYYPGGYGSDWLEDFVKEFIATKKYDGDVEKVTKSDYKLTAREDVGSASSIIMKSKSCPDLILANGIENQDISDGLVADLTDVYNTEVNTSAGKIAIKDYIMPESRMSFTRSIRVGGASGQWAVPWTAIPLSIAYNETLLNKITHTTSGNAGDCIVDGKWAKAPTTFEELLTCFNDIAAQGQVDGQDVKAFGFSMKDGTLWFESLIYVWWAQYQGIDESNIVGQDAFYDFFNLDTAEKYKQDGIVKALEKVQQLITKDGAFANVYGDPSALTIKDVQPAFARGEMVFCLTGDFFAKEYKTTLDANKEKVNVKLMKVPAFDTTHNQNYTFLNTTSCMYVPENAKNKDLAKEFLAFINDEDHLVRFTAYTGGIRPFGTNTTESKAAIKAKYLTAKDWGDFEKSTFDLYFDCDDVVMSFPRNYKNRPNEEPSIFYTYNISSRSLWGDYPTLLDKMRTDTIVNLVINNEDSLYELSKQNYEDKKSNYGSYMITSIA